MEDIVHEIQLRLDMAKIRFNSILIKLKLHKIFKKFMFQTKDYYFMKNRFERENVVNKVVNNVKGNKNDSNDKKVNDRNSVSDSHSTNMGSNDSMDNSYSRLDDDEDEINPLKK